MLKTYFSNLNRMALFGAVVTTFLMTADLALAQQPMAPQQMVAPQQGAQQPFVPPEYQLNTIEQTYLNQVLDQWEQQSAQINTFSCKFTRLVYDPIFGPGNDNYKNEEKGELSYQQPDKGSFQIKEVKAWDAKQQTHILNPSIIGEHWVCDGKAVFEYKTSQKLLVERPIPPEMQGKSIVDGPLPFLFGAEAEKLKKRYWMRIDHRALKNQIRIVARPKLKADAANYREVELMLDKKRMLPVAMQVHNLDNSRTVYTFDMDSAQINARIAQLWNQLFQSPRTPFGWTRVVEDGKQKTQQMAQPGMNIRRQ